VMGYRGIGKSGDRVLGASFLNIRSVFYLP